MKLNINSILEALFIPKPNDYLKRNHTDNQYGRGLIFIPIPERTSIEKRIYDRKK
ncbi:MAG TPA: hypothetical protein VMH01_12260 [Puia sp.]|nr:hypothetical protein [Puia sp.]